ncbi:polymorphic toxin-type HINT domain-containing protein [Streptomyces sp. NPDC059835]|uniref:polymorphic toxin-type HINT domain-containing protein n=1 Tax=Streptomyces sp. NPDC059835 TaxID=3346967 RepID=UPI00365BBF48
MLKKGLARALSGVLAAGLSVFYSLGGFAVFIRSGVMPELFGGDRIRRKRRFRTGIVGATSVALSVSLLSGPAWAGPSKFKPRDVQKTKSVEGKNLKATGKKAPAKPKDWKPAPVTWPAAGTTQVTLPAGKATAKAAPATPVQAGSLPVRVAPAGNRSAAAGASPATGPGKVTVTLADRKRTQQAGINGLLLSVKRSDGSAAAATAQVEVDYSKFKDAFGANWSSSLQLVALPDCALTTPAKAECLKGTPLRTQNDEKNSTLTAAVDLPATGAPSSVLTKQAPSMLAAPAGGMTALAAVASADGSEGSFTATSLAPSGSWSAGGNSGSFSWNVPISVPPAPGGLSPKVALSYSSSSVDGRTGSTNNQSSWVGEGWEYSPGFVERKYVPCNNDMQGGNNTEKTGDLCWKSENATLSLNGSSSELLWDAAKNVWKLSNDDGSRVERIYDSPGNNSGDADSEYWRVTTTDGTQYWFGKNRLPGWTTGKEETLSVNWVPVFGNHAGEQGHGADFASSSENQGWRWNLDYVVDPHGNAMALYYTKFGGYYSKNGKYDAPVVYTRDSVLEKISYGLRAGQVYTPALAPAQVNFTVSQRCKAATCTFDTDHATDWPDVPINLNCTSGTQCLQGTPTFWSTKRLTSIDTVVLSGGAHVPVDTWTLAQSYPPTGDTTKPALWLDSVQHTAKAGALTDIPLEPTVFSGTPMANRVDKADGRPPINKYRITQVTNETGGNTLVTYTVPNCSATSLPASDDTNTKRCYPSWWTRDGGTTEVKDYFHKYLTAKVEEADTTAGTGSPSKTTTYVYPGNANWARDESEFTLDKHRTWNDFHGYRTVRTLVGTTNRVRTETDFYLGMAGDKLANGTPRTVAAINGVTDRSDFTGTVSETRAYDGEAGTAVAKTTHTPWVSGDNASQPVTGITDPDQAGTPGPTLASKVARFSGTSTTVASKLLTGGTWQQSTSTRIYDQAYGLLRTEGNDGANTTEATCTVTQYTTPDTANWLIDYPSQMTSTTAKPCTETIAAQDVTGASRTSYDGQAPGTAPKPGQALPTKVEDASKLDASSQLVWETTGQATHDPYGRVLTSKGQDGQTTTMAYTPAADAQPTTITATDPKGYSATTTYDGLRGLVLTTTDANDRRITSQYDALGRLIKGWGPGRPTTQQPNITHTYNLSATAPSTVTTKKLYEDSTWGTAVTLYDSLLRPRQSQSDATGTAGRVITDTTYDNYGRVLRTNAPYFNNQPTSTTLFVVPDNQIPSATEIRYDSRGRATDSILLSLNTEKWRTTTTYGPDWQAVVPPQGGTATLTISDARGRVVERRDYKDRTPVITAAATQYEKHSYTYDRAGQLAKMADNSGRNAWTYSYDLRGRQTESNDPDKGKTTSVYGADGRPQSSTDARGVTLATTYDELGRRTSLRKGTVTGTKLAEWTYDTATGGKGLPATATRYDGTAAYTSAVTGYDTGGRPTGTKVTIPTVTGEEKLAGTYTVASTATPVSGLPATTAYSTTNTNATNALPAETVTNRYGAQDQLAIVGSYDLEQSYLAGASYTEFGELAQATLGNAGTNIYQTLTRDPATRRVIRSDTDRAASAPTGLSSVKYTYDPAGNITRILDDQNDVTIKDDQCFAYDWARRLTEAWTSGDDCTTKPVNGSGTPNLGTVDPYWTSWTFTDSGQRATEKQHKAGPVTADTTRTHAYPTGTTPGHELLNVTATGGATGTDTFAYDNAGNLTTKDTAAAAAQTLTWNDEGKIATSTVSGATTSFLYDTVGTRILKREPATTTLYLPGGQELILAKATGTVTGNRYYPVPGGSAIRSSSDGRVRFLVADHHGTNNLSIAATTLTFNRRKSLPYGAERGAPPAFWPGQKGFVGGDTDTTTGFTHIGAREYDPTTGQFISVDPLLSFDLPQSLNGYNYANNSPITSSDPNGERETCGAYGNSCYENDYNNDGTPNKDNNRSTGQGSNECGNNDPDCGNKGGRSSNSSGAVSESVRQAESAATSFARAYMDDKAYAAWLAKYQKNLNGYIALGHGDFSENDVNAAAVNVCFGPDAVYCPQVVKNHFEDLEWWHTVGTGATPEIGSGLGAALKASGAVGKGAGRGAPCNQCFLAGTKVLMADGSTKNIEDIKPGEKVRATDPETGETGEREVTDLIVTEDDKHFNTLSISTEDGIKELTATYEHPFWSPSANAWVEARDLAPGSTLLTSEYKTVIVTANKPYTHHARTYNLTVDDIHTYYVLAGSTPILVHNCNGGVAPDGTACACNGSTNPSTPDLIQAIATRAQTRLGGSGPVSGTLKHSYAENLLNRYQGIYGDRGLIQEQSYLGGVQVPRGTAGSARPDVYDPASGIIYDYKFVQNPGRGIGQSQANKNASNVPGAWLTIEVNP